MVSSKLGEQKESVVQALREAEDRFKRYLSKQVKEEKEMSSLITEEASEGDEDIKWLLESGNKKVCVYSYSEARLDDVHVHVCASVFSLGLFVVACTTSRG